mmetsp:Transcript_12445/g.40576  ORF Transcript_12445/g.40576 Transcript_12445/m.40576 type:complete len:203 (+) Transcript_12445:327-935(+)
MQLVPPGQRARPGARVQLRAARGGQGRARQRHRHATLCPQVLSTRASAPSEESRHARRWGRLYTTFGASPHHRGYHRRTDCQRRTCRVMICLSTSRSSLCVWLRPRAYAPHNRLFLSLFAVSLRFSLQPSCHLAVAPFSSCSPLSLLPLSRRSPLPRSATPPPPAGPLFSLLLAPFGAAPPSSLHILAPRVYRALLAQGRVF